MTKDEALVKLSIKNAITTLKDNTLIDGILFDNRLLITKVIADNKTYIYVAETETSDIIEISPTEDAYTKVYDIYVASMNPVNK